MRIARILVGLSAGALIATGAGMWGCESTGGEVTRRSRDGDMDSARSTYGDYRAPDRIPVSTTPRAAAPAPAPQPAARPAPRPATTGDMMFLPTGDRNTSALSLRCAMPREVIAGANFTYDLEVCNLTSMTLQNVNVSYSLDGGRLVSSEPAANNNNFAIGDLGAGQCKTIKVTATAADTGTVRGCMGATWNNSLCCATNVVQPALRVVKSVSPSDGTPCDTFTYKIDVTNTGTGAATNVKLTDNLPAGVMSQGKSNLSWDIGTINAGQTVSRTFTASASKTGSFANFASATADNNLSAKSSDVSIAIKQPKLELTKACPKDLRLGRSSAFKVTVKNTGDAPAAATVVEDTLPSGSTFVSATDGGQLQGGKVVWNVGTLAPGASKELGLVLNVTSMGTVQNTASARATCADVVTANCSYSIQGVPDLGTLLTDIDGVVLVGNNHSYQYEVENQGQVDLTNVSVVVTLPEGMSFVSSNAPKPPAVSGNKLTFTGVTGVLKPGEKRSFSMVVKCSAPGEKLVISETTCDQLKTPVRDDELTNFVE